MLAYFLRRLVTVFIPTLLGISILVFVIMHMIPGSFVDVLLGIGTDISDEMVKSHSSIPARARSTRVWDERSGCSGPTFCVHKRRESNGCVHNWYRI